MSSLSGARRLETDFNVLRQFHAKYLAYLAGRAREQPEMWVCEKCMALHPIDQLDTPTSENNHSSCPRSLSEIWTDTRLHFHQIRIGHRHVQLALKYVRMRRDRDERYIRALLTPHHDYFFGSNALIPLRTYYSAHPKIVACPENGNYRFLLFSKWRYLKGNEDITVSGINHQVICPHLQFHNRGVPSRRGPYSVLETAIIEALEARDDPQERTGACPRCATDFSVQAAPEYLYLQVWQDFGPECSPADIAWRSQCVGPDSNGRLNGIYTGPTLYHEPGSIRELYKRMGCA